MGVIITKFYVDEIYSKSDVSEYFIASVISKMTWFKQSFALSKIILGTLNLYVYFAGTEFC